MSGIWGVQTRVLYGLSPHDEFRFTTLSTFLCLAGRLAVLVLPLSFAQPVCNYINTQKDDEMFQRKVEFYVKRVHMFLLICPGKKIHLVLSRR